MYDNYKLCKPHKKRFSNVDLVVYCIQNRPDLEGQNIRKVLMNDAVALNT